MAHSPEDLELIRSIGMRSFVSVPLISRGRRIGALTLVQAWSGRRQDEQDAQFARVLAGRAALVLENAGLFSDLESIEQRMDVVMDVVDEAVTRQRRRRRSDLRQPRRRRADGLRIARGAARARRAPASSVSRSTGRSGRPLSIEGTLFARHVGRERAPVIRLVRPDGEEIWLRIRSRDRDRRRRPGALPGLGVRRRHGPEGGGVRADGPCRRQRAPARRAEPRGDHGRPRLDGRAAARRRLRRLRARRGRRLLAGSPSPTTTRSAPTISRV